MRRRAELVDQTRLRITEAAVRLHTTVGPSNTSISTVAEEAGVTRLTVYRHFPDLEHLFDACRGHWIGPPPAARTRPPGSASPISRSGRGLAFDRPVRLVSARTPTTSSRSTGTRRRCPPRRPEQPGRAGPAGCADALVAGHAGGGRRGRALRAVAGHLTGYWTWRSLEIDQGLGPDETVDLAVRLLLAAAPPTT